MDDALGHLGRHSVVRDGGNYQRSSKGSNPKAQDNVAVGEAEVKHMLPLMDQDKDGNGNVSKQDFMEFMEAEFDRLDKKKEGKLDVKKLTQPPAQPVRGFHK
jgi:Ca2+-binding EF-hand superfamily protein